MQLSRAQYVWISLLAVILILCGAAYADRSKTLPPIVSTNVQFVNAYALQDRVPQATYTAILDHVEYYLAVKHLAGTTLTITGTPSYNDTGLLTFNFRTNDSNASHTVNASSTDYGEDVVSTTVAVDNTEIDYAPVANLFGTSLNNFDELTNNGLSGAQAYEIEKMLTTFAPGRHITLNINSIKPTKTDTNLQVTFTVAIDNTTYTASDVSTGLSDVSLTLTDASGAQAFHGAHDLSD